MVWRTKARCTRDIRIIGADLVGFRAREAGDAVRVADAEALIDFRIEPEFGAFPQSQTGEQRGVRRLAGLSAMRQAVGTLIGRSDSRVALPGEGGLAVEIDQVQVGCRWPFGNDRPCVRRCSIVAELIVQTGAHLLHRKVGIEVLGAAKERPAAIAVTR